ncbi:restriction endonuclease subunit S [Rothia dentocariosa]|uniref:restriction endonuclease subunit S n=1 Tax=Rothia dentocariosa TaxID=2047 RepID=UPI0028808373|nr:restriction endonuclease subunit S [Rothia dentocariosa]
MSENTKDMPKISSGMEAPKALNYIEKLVAELCPDGVEYVEISELFDTKNGYTPSKSIPSYWQDGEIPWFRMEDIRVNGRVLNDSLKHVHKSAVKNGKIFPQNSIIFATSATIGEHALIKVPFLCNQRFTALSVKNKYLNKVNIKFLFYYGFILDEWCKSNTTQSSFASVDMKGFKKFKFPLPPLEIQNAIVEILDKFTKLEAELAARRAQYEYYRNSLFENLSGGGSEILGNLVQYVRDKTKSLMKPLEYVGVENLNVDFQGCTPSLSTISGTQYIPSDILLGNIRPYLKKMWISNNEGVAGSDVLVIRVKDEYRNDIIPKFLYHQLTTSRFLDYNVRNSRGGKMPRGNKKKILEFPIFLPPLAEQERIVKILDKFDALVNDISSGLPAEIEARRKQYEYYRDRLLTFPRASDFTEHKH